MSAILSLMSDPSARLLWLLSMLQTGREWPGRELAERLTVSPRTIRRDVDRLRELGYPVEASMGALGGYRLVAGAAMPPLLLDDDEAVAVAVGLRTAAGQPVEGLDEASVRALAKLDQVLPHRLRHRVRTLGAATMPIVGATDPVDPAVLVVLASAVAGRERVRFTHGGRGEPARRHAEPAGLVSGRGRWYLVGYDLDRDDWRTYRVDRVRDARATGARFTPRDLPAADPAAFVTGRRSDWPAAGHHVVVTFRAPPAQVAGRLGDQPGDVTAIDETTSRLEAVREDDLGWLAQRLAALGCDFEVAAPPELRAAVAAMADRLNRAVQR